MKVFAHRLCHCQLEVKKLRPETEGGSIVRWKNEWLMNQIVHVSLRATNIQTLQMIDIQPNII